MMLTHHHGGGGLLVDAGEFKGKTAVVTGAASGIGRAILEAFVRHGANGILVDVDSEWGSERADLLRREGHDVTFIKTDVRKSDQVARVFEVVAAEHHGTDVLVNCAGVGVHKEVVELTEEEWDFQVDIQLKGVFLTCREAARQMIAQKRGGRIINIGSGAALVARPHAGPHCASKAGAAHLTRVLALELGPHGITANVVSPGLTDVGPTSHWGGSTPDYQRKFLPEVPLGRLARPEEIADAVLFFASDKAKFITGQLVNIDGGYTAGKLGIRGSHRPTPLTFA
jgi:NAD(P)-dependent dehydrogenase (short-subunit alcohol dehydrogenase family)